MAKDINRIKSNVKKMLDQGATSGEVGRYLATEGVSARQLRGETAGRMVLQAIEGAGEGIAETLALPFELSAAAARLLGLTEQRPGVVEDAFKSTGIDVVSEPRGESEELSRAVGRGVGIAAPIPAAGLAGLGRATTQAGQQIAKSLMAQPLAQLSISGASEGVAEATDSPLAGLATAVLSPFALSGAQKLVSPGTADLARREALKAAKRLNVPVMPSQKTDSTIPDKIESLAAQTLAGGLTRKQRANQRERLNEIILEKAGISEKKVTDGAIAKQFNVLGKDFDGFFKGKEFDLPKDIDAQINTVRQSLEQQNIDPGAIDKAEDFLEKIRSSLNDSGKLSGERLQARNKELNKILRNKDFGEDDVTALRQVQDFIFDIQAKNFSGEQLKDLKKLRSEYRGLLLLEKAYRFGAQAERQAGDIPLNRYRSEIVRQKAVSRRFPNEFNDIANVIDLVADAQRDSGTAGRTFNLGTLGAGAFGVGTGDLSTLLPTVGAALAPEAAAQLVNRYFANRLLSPRSVSQQTDLATSLLAPRVQDIGTEE